ncbi:uncharacterized protein LOC122293188 isoform X2 [Carya illinoinensis]|uniref:uncharacterized protein LOC122293188 isoform X2 n=1 Tax=Carya illinoinensis TaxID=32201 RepID=UPI001C722F3A|nr:uncharacterized protein LOC122293188 isoform X2 [Carya illinoinensis]
MASMRNAFPSGNRLVFWKQWIYNSLATTIETRWNTPNVESSRQHNQVIQMESGNQSAPATFETHLNIPNVENGRQRKKVITRIKSAPVFRRDLSFINSCQRLVRGNSSTYSPSIVFSATVAPPNSNFVGRNSESNQAIV